uniref:MFS domain-containing protein n=1 Tax=Ascaris lumbricoides TaxID=6252 RepID=A0A0M3IN51_ASCLU
MGSEKESKSSVRLEDDSANDERTKLQVEETPAQVKGPVKNVDDFLRIGWYTLYAGTTAEFVVFNMLSNMVFMVYSGAAPVVKSCGNFHANTTDGDICDQYSHWRAKNECVPELDYQFLSANVEDNSRCQFPYKIRHFQFDYLCGEGKAVKNSISVQMLGVLLGTLIFGQLSDSFGRRKVLFVCTIAAIILGAASSFSNSLWSLTLWRAATGCFAGGEVM